MVTQKEHRECVGARRLAWKYYGTIPLKGLCTFTAHTPFNTSDAATDAAVMRCSASDTIVINHPSAIIIL
jgi:hypothetical protein